MPKLKTKSSAKKRFKLTASGLVKSAYAGKRHGMRKRPQNRIRDARGMDVMHVTDQRRIIKHYLHG